MATHGHHFYTITKTNALFKGMFSSKLYSYAFQMHE